MDNDHNTTGELKSSLAVHGAKLLSAGFVFLLVLTAFVAVKTVEEVKGYRYADSGIEPQATISVSGKGEEIVIPDVAEFSFSITRRARTVAEAQQAVTETANQAAVFLKESGVAENDIKTTGYNIYPRYEYRRDAPCTEYRCPPSGERVLAGYEVTQQTHVKVRDTDKVGGIFSGLGEIGTSNISSLRFSVDDEERVKRLARTEAIADAKERARALARDLGVQLVRIISFSESGATPYPRHAIAPAVSEGKGGGVPEISVGENTVTVNVNIVYEIR